MIRYSWKVWTYRFSVAELKEWLKEEKLRENANNSIIEVMEDILIEVSEFSDEEEIEVRTGDECDISSTSVPEINIDLDVYDADFVGYLNTKEADNGDLW